MKMDTDDNEMKATPSHWKRCYFELYYYYYYKISENYFLNHIEKNNYNISYYYKIYYNEY